jgi:hypothetical protein
VYCGIYRVEKVRSILEDKLGKDPESFDERSDGASCLFAFSVTDDGRPLFDTFVLSTCAWATARALEPGPGSAEWLSEFDTTASTIASSFAEQLAVRRDDSHGQGLKGKGFNLGRPIAYADFVKDLGKVAAEARKQNLGKGCWTFLSGDDELDVSKRIDVRTSISTLFQQLSPALFPPGR